MTEVETDPATSPRQAEDAYLAAVSALLCAIATGRLLTGDEVESLVDAMPDTLGAELWLGLEARGLRG